MGYTNRDGVVDDLVALRRADKSSIVLILQVFQIRRLKVDEGQPGGGTDQVDDRDEGAQDAQDDGPGADRETAAMHQTSHDLLSLKLHVNN